MNGIKTDAVIRDARSLRATVTLHHDRLSERSYLFTMSDITHPHAASRLHDGHEFNFSANELRATARIRTTAWWSQTGSNRRPHACKARALPTELWPHLRKRRAAKQKRWWAWEDLNFRPHAYQARALTN